MFSSKKWVYIIKFPTSFFSFSSIILNSEVANDRHVLSNMGATTCKMPAYTERNCHFNITECY